MLDATVLKTAILGALQASPLFAPDLATKAPATSKFVEILSEQIITHFKTFGVINSNVAVTSVSAVTPGPGISGPGVGTAVGTIS